MSWSAFDTFTDPDAYHAAISSAYARSRSDGVVTARGNFRADFARIQLDRVLLRHARETLPRTAYSAMDPRQFLIAFTTDPRQQIYVSGLELVPDAIVVFRHPKGTIVMLQLVDGAASLCRMRMLRLRGRR